MRLLALLLLLAGCDVGPGIADPPYDPDHVCQPGDVHVGCVELDAGVWDHDPDAGAAHCYCATDPRSTG